jgi:L-glutamine-phosphate cytidylyltransferase
VTQAILLGAGQGSRLDEKRGEHPKWMLEVAGQSLAQHLVNALHSCDVTDVQLVRGALGGTVLSPSVSYRDAINTRNMLETLYSVRSAVHDDVIVAYCDLILEPRLIAAALAAPGVAAVVVDRRWYDLFSLRADDPLSIAESCSLSDTQLKRIGQPLAPREIPEAQYIGLMRFSKDAFHQLMTLYESLAAEFAGQPWRNAKSFEAAYFTDFLQEAIARRIALTAVPVEGGWLEFDTPRDLSLANDLVVRPKPAIFAFQALPPLPSVLSAGGVAVRRRGAQEEVLLVGSGSAGEWRIPKGMLERGETVQAAASREVMEETGVPVQIDRFVCCENWNYVFNGQDWWERCYFHRFSPLSDAPPRADSEHAVATWLPSNLALEGMMFENERHALSAALVP